jgi:hypothetical protein
MIQSRVGAVLVAALCASGCFVIHKSYLESALPRVERADIVPGPTPAPVQLSLTCLDRTRIDYPPADRLRLEIVTAMAETGLFNGILDTHDDGVAKLDLVLEETADDGAEVGAGVLTMVTLGIWGTANRHPCTWRVTWTAPGKPPLQKKYEYSIHLAFGIYDPPAGFEPLETGEIHGLVRHVILLLLRDLQNEAHISG